MQVGDLVHTSLGLGIIIEDVSGLYNDGRDLTKLFRVAYLADNWREDGEWFEYQLEVISEVGSTKNN